ncbi:MAG: phosphatase PAP2 family protein [Gammaproteobacteria bacterium]|nr:phosphatase PAP2 family protein [Gammaproteobacteria bacterium]
MSFVLSRPGLQVAFATFLVLIYSCPCFSQLLDTNNAIETNSSQSRNKTDWQDWGEVVVGGLFAVGMATRFDENVRSEMQGNDDVRSQPIASIGNQWAEIGGVGVASALVGVGWYSDDKRWLHTGKTMVWSSAVGATAARAGKYAGGRLRPYQSEGSDHWFDGRGESFPSGHTTQAFALSVAYAESVPNPSWQRRTLAYSLAVSTAYARMYDNKHWLSDTVAGAIVGSLSALAVIKYDLAEKGLQVLVSPGAGGEIGVSATKTW